MGENKLFWFIENYGNKYRKVGNCIRLTYVKDLLNVKYAMLGNRYNLVKNFYSSKVIK